MVPSNQQKRVGPVPQNVGQRFTAHRNDSSRISNSLNGQISLTKETDPLKSRRQTGFIQRTSRQNFGYGDFETQSNY